MGNRTVLIMAALERAPDGLSTPEIIVALAEPDIIAALAEPAGHRAALTAYGHVLRRHATAGRVEGAGQTAGGWQQGRARIWRITDAGRRWLATEREGPAGRRRAAREEAERAAARADEAAARDRALTAARENLGRLAPAERARVARALRELGCGYAEIGAALGVSRETARGDCVIYEPAAESAAKQTLAAVLDPLDPASQARVVRWLAAYFTGRAA